MGEERRVVVNKRDLVTRQSELDEVERFVLANSEKVLGAQPDRCSS